MKIRHEINIITENVSSITSGSNQAPHIIELDPARYSGTLTAYFEIVAQNDDSAAKDVDLIEDPTRNIALSSTAATISVPTSATTPTRLRSSSFTISSTDVWKTIDLASTTATADLVVYAARIIVIEDTGVGDLTETLCQFEIGSDELRNDTADVPQLYPKYWKYEADKWSATGDTWDFYFHFTAELENDMYSLFINLEEDDGAFENWTDVFTSHIEIAGSNDFEDPYYHGNYTSTYKFTPTDGRHYRITMYAENTKGDVILYNAKIIAYCPAATSIEKLQEQYLLINQLASTTGLTNKDQYYDPAEWDDVSLHHYHQVDGDDAIRRAKIQEDPNGTPVDIDGSIARIARREDSFVSDGMIIGGDIESYETEDSQQLIFGGTGTWEEAAQAFQLSTAARVRGVILMLDTNGTPTDNLIVKITSTLGGTALATATFNDVSDILTKDRVELIFDTEIDLAASTTYYIEASRSGGRDGTNHAIWQYHNTNATYANGNRWVKNSGTWSEQTGDDHYFIILGEMDMPTSAETIDTNVLNA